MDCPPQIYSQLLLAPCHPFNELEAEFLFVGGKLNLYLNSLSLQLPFIEGDEFHAEVVLFINGEETRCLADRLEGGQRLLLPDPILYLIANSLLEGFSVELLVGNYRTILIPDNFIRIDFKDRMQRQRESS